MEKMNRFEEFEKLTNELLVFSSLGIRPGLERVSRLLSVLGSPQKRYKAIHILGTNGKGSTAATIESICAAAGMKTALYTSPHLVSLQERLRVGCCELPIGLWRRAFEHIQAAVASDPVLSDARPTFFENLTAMAFWMMAEQNPDIAVIEAGLGGRYDATSVCDALATVVTPIGMDHMEYLGDTLQSIAAEKFAAIRPGIPAFYAADDKALCGQFMEQCKSLGAPAFPLDEIAQPEDIECRLSGTSFSYAAGSIVLKDLRTPLNGPHQAYNVTRAISVLLQMGKFEEPFSAIREPDIRSGLSGTDWPGRFEVIRRKDTATIVLDGAHNDHGAKALVGAVACLLADREIHRVAGIVFAVMKDKSITPILDELKTLNCPVFCTQLPMERSLSAQALAAMVSDCGLTVGGVYENPGDALEEAVGQTLPTDLVVCCGSLFLVGHLRPELHAVDDRLL